MTDGPSDRAQWVRQTRPLSNCASNGPWARYQAELLPPLSRWMPGQGKSPHQAATELGLNPTALSLPIMVFKPSSWGKPEKQNYP